MTYAELLQRIRDYTEVDSSVLTNSICDTFIKNSELKIFREADADYSREYATSSFNPGNRYVVLPDDNSDEGASTIRRAFIVRSVVVTNSSSIQVSLDPKDDTFITEYNASGSSGFPKYYSMYRENAIQVAPIPDNNYAITLDYVYTPDNLSSTNTTTYISLNAPELLLYACLVEAFGYLKGPMDMYKLYQDKYNTALQGFTIEQTGRRRRDEYFDGSLRIKINSPSP